LACQGTPYDIILSLDIYKGKRPIIPTHVPKLVAELINKCLNTQPNKRTTSEEVYEAINIWYNELLKDESTAKIKEVDETIVDKVELKHEEMSKKSNNI
ncbi:6461_t:CDS:1, partial [Gigaspora margarita]